MAGTDLKAGTVLSGLGGSWRLGRKLGNGSFGYVYECANAAASGSSSEAFPFAIKIAQKVAPKGAKANKVTGGQSVAAGLMNAERLLYSNVFR